MLQAKAPRSAANTLEPYNELNRCLDRLGSRSGLFQQVHPDSVVRAVASSVEQATSKLANEIATDPRVYSALKAVDLSKADAETQFYVFKQLRDFRRSGIDKDDATRARIRDLNEQVVRITQAFDQNLSADHSTYTVDGVAALEGLPDDYVKAHAPGADGRITLKSNYVDYIPFVTYAKSDKDRAGFFKVFMNRAYPVNVAELDTLVRLRRELATTLGYPNYAAYATGDKMIGSDTAVATFIDRVCALANTRMEADRAALLARKQKDDPAATAVNAWETSYYTELVKKEQYSFSSQEVRPYFPYARVKQGLFDVTSKMFGLTYKPVRGVPVWHPSVEVYDVYQGREKLGRFYLDMHPRANKYSHAANFPIQTGIKGRQLPMATLVCNFPEPAKGDPGLMEHEDVDTFFHEFGHLLHHILGGRHPWIGTSGISTEWDFVEAPSTLLEEWVWDAATLQTFARHHQTGQPIPDELVNRMRAARDFGKGAWVRQQMFYAALSLRMHDRDPNGLDSDKLVQELQAKYSPWPYVEGTHMQAGFTHLTGYSAIYYTYMWSMVIAKDMFSAFSGGPILNPQVAGHYRKTVLEAGGSKPAAELVKDFLGREYSTRAYEEWLNRN
ncbi:MAG: Zn-dependent oligopeptidase [Candidatus Eisenbacteria bacterium]|nr:Zn-dependent oligopeptidase [Candidatus Eisenbacteria bacterium]